jgi:cell division protein FtsN
MVKKPDGEFEVLLGNTQLLSLFVIVVILLAVFFTMGYVLGRHSGAASAEVVVSKEAPAPALPRATPAEPPAPLPKPESTPAESAPPAVAPSAPATAPAVQPAPPPAAPTKQPAREIAPSSTPPAPAAGQTFLQVVAGRRPDAEVVAGVLKKKGFSTVIVPSPTEGVFRVLVGPFADAGAVTEARKNLEKAGFDKAIARKY